MKEWIFLYLFDEQEEKNQRQKLFFLTNQLEENVVEKEHRVDWIFSVS